MTRDNSGNFGNDFSGLAYRDLGADRDFVALHESGVVQCGARDIGARQSHRVKDGHSHNLSGAARLPLDFLDGRRGFFFTELPGDLSFGVARVRIAMASQLFLIFKIVHADNNAIHFEVQLGNIRFQLGQIREVKRFRLDVWHTEIFLTPLCSIDFGFEGRSSNAFDRVGNEI